MYGYRNTETGDIILGFCWYSNGENLDELSRMFAQSNGIDESIISKNYNKGQPIALMRMAKDDYFTQYIVMTNGIYGYAIGYSGNNDLLFYNLLYGIETEGLIGVGGYEIVSTQEYYRIPLKGFSYRIYTENGRVDENTAKEIWWELSYKNIYEGFDLTTVWFYDMKSAAGIGSPYGMISQDELGQEIKYEEMQ